MEVRDGEGIKVVQFKTLGVKHTTCLAVSVGNSLSEVIMGGATAFVISLAAIMPAHGLGCDI